MKNRIEKTINILTETAKMYGLNEKILPEIKVNKKMENKEKPIPKKDEIPETDSNIQQLDILESVVAECKKCKLYKTRNKIVFGQGSKTAELVLVGEAPGKQEDLTGQAFVGRAGNLLTKILASINIDRKDVYICNIIKCRPPGNRNPVPDEIESCEPYLIKQLDLIKPKVICTLGTFASQTLLRTGTPIGELRGQWYEYNEIPLIVTYHPAACLYSPAKKRPVWEDMKKLRKKLDEL